MLWDGPEDGIATYNYQEEEDWSKTVAQCCLLDTIPQVLIKTSGSMLCTKAYTLSTNGDKRGSVLFTINLNVCTNINKGNHVYEEMSLKKSGFSEHKTL